MNKSASQWETFRKNINHWKIDKEYDLKPFLTSKNAISLVYFRSTKPYDIEF